jgi:adenosylcobinamide kinase/adenosylcobinamide-phosphate guanylyltransferase
MWIMIKSDNRLVLVIGGAGSGKSEFAENVAVEMWNENPRGHLFYVATMKTADDETKIKIQKHVARRENTAFETVELPTDIGKFTPEKDDVILLECMSNLLANEMFTENEIKTKCVKKICNDLEKLHNSCQMVVVSNEVSLDGCDYDATTREYIENLCRINRYIANLADEVVEVVAGIPIYAKR